MAVVKPHTCFAGVDCPLVNMKSMLSQPFPADDENVCTDFDLYQYLLCRPMSMFAEFGGMVCVLAEFILTDMVLTDLNTQQAQYFIYKEH